MPSSVDSLKGAMSSVGAVPTAVIAPPAVTVVGKKDAAGASGSSTACATPGMPASAMPAKAIPAKATATKAMPAKEADPSAAPKGSKRRKAVAGEEMIAVEGDEKSAEGSWLIVAKAVRMHLKNHETAMHCGSDALPALNAKVAELINDAIARSQSNGRKTIKASDF